MRPSSYEQQAPCNRVPFLSEDGCDRGSVDIHMFDELPYCGKISPTLPEIPPEIVDVPLIPLPGPPCSCIYITHKFDMSYNTGDRAFSASTSFKALGDCCGGNYQTDFRLKIPCPVVGMGERKLTMAIGYGDGPASYAGTYASVDGATCLITPKDISVGLNIPCPVVGDDGTKKIKVGISYGQGAPSASASFVIADGANCRMEPLDAALHLNIRCPLVGEQGPRRIRSKIRYDSGFASASAVFAKVDPENCQINPVDTDLDLTIPCPVVGDDGTKKIKVGISYGEAFRSASASFLSVDRENCHIGAVENVLNLQIPCPMSKSGLNIRTTSKYGSSAGLRVKTDQYDPATCARDILLEATFPDMSIDIPCPVSGAGATMKFGKLGFGTPESVSADVMEVGDCYVQGLTPEVSLKVPPPTTAERLVITGSGSIDVSSSYDSTSFRRTFRLKVRSRPCFDVIVGLRWNKDGNKTFEYQKKNTCTSSSGEWHALFTAIPYTGNCQ